MEFTLGSSNEIYCRFLLRKFSLQDVLGGILSSSTLPLVTINTYMCTVHCVVRKEGVGLCWTPYMYCRIHILQNCSNILKKLYILI
jgi:hypothetical protein